MKPLAMKTNLEEENQILRELLWLHHGHPSMALYGDDGEMQCAECLKEYGFYDWKRTPAKEIQERIYKANMKKLANNGMHADLAGTSMKG